MFITHMLPCWSKSLFELKSERPPTMYPSALCIASTGPSMIQCAAEHSNLKQESHKHVLVGIEGGQVPSSQ